jgi:ubiquinone/menaquinone biosynthesis C-methylase UbiE
MNDFGDEHRSAERKEREFEDQIADRYNRDYHEPPILASHSLAFVQYVAKHVKGGDRVLDLGCGAASLWGLFRNELPSNVSLTGVDLSPGMLSVAKAAFPDGEFREGSFLSIPFVAGSFDVVIVSSAFHHISDELLPGALAEIGRVLDEHGLLVGREPLDQGRLSDRGGWFAGALMNLRHLVYRLTHTREYPEPDPGPHHHAYEVNAFLAMINVSLQVTELRFKNPASFFLARSTHPLVVAIANKLDEIVGHKMGQEIHYSARKNFADSAMVVDCVRRALEENFVTKDELIEFLALVEASSKAIESELGVQERPVSIPLIRSK